MNTSNCCSYCGTTIAKLLKEYLVTHDWTLLDKAKRLEKFSTCCTECSRNKYSDYEYYERM